MGQREKKNQKVISFIKVIYYKRISVSLYFITEKKTPIFPHKIFIQM
jgi:hypothetical protein